ncbi:MAG: hypothetical protein ACOYYS_25795 [Chloroflexota bacterium]
MGGGEFIDFDTTRKHRTHSSGSFGSVSDDTYLKVGRVSAASAALLPLVNGKCRRVDCFHRHPIVCMLDVTGSMGDSVYVVYEKLGTFFLEVQKQNYLDDPAISFAAVGDCHCDRAPLQVAQFSQSMELIGYLEQLYIEHGGGGQTSESYETMLYYYWKYCDLQNSEVPFLFIIGDEGFYKKVSGSHRRHYFGEPLAGDVGAEVVFREIKRKFAGNVFLLHLPYGSSDADQQILSQWRAMLGENVINLEDPTLVVEVMLGIIAMAMDKRSMKTYLDDFRTLYQADRLKNADPGRDDTEEKVRTMRKILAPYSQAAGALIKAPPEGSLPARDGNTRSRRSA